MRSVLASILGAMRAGIGHSFTITPELVDACLKGTVADMTNAIVRQIQPIPTRPSRGSGGAVERTPRPSRPTLKPIAKTGLRLRDSGLRSIVGPLTDVFSLDRDRSPPSEARRKPVRSARPNAAVNRAPPRRDPRYGNAVVLDSKTGEVLTTIDPGHTVRLRIDIGPLSKTSQVQGAKPLPLPKESMEIDVDVMVSSSDFRVAPGASPRDGVAWSDTAQARLRLPQDGGPGVAEDGGNYLDYYLLAPEKLEGPAHARINYYYKSVLLQSQKLTLSPPQQGASDAKPSLKIFVDYTASDDFSGLEAVPERPRFSILTNDNDDGRHQIVIRRLDAAGSPSSRNFTLNSDGISSIIERLRNTLRDNAPSDKRRSARSFISDLKDLAPIGWELYGKLPGQVPMDFYQALVSSPQDFVVQISRPDTSGFVLPWSCMYEIPLISDVTPTLCPMVENWDGNQPLFTGDLRQCPCGPHLENVLCPFGFWGYRYAIEQLSSSDKPVLSIPAAPRCDVVVGEAQYDLDIGALDAHVNRLRALLAKMPVDAQLREGKDKASIERLLGADLPFIYFYCHGERVNIKDPNTYLGVGKGEKITAQDLIGWTATWYARLKKLIWNSVRPLVFINACHTVAIEPKTLVSYLQAFISRGRAAGVIGTEVLVDQSLAMDVAERFVATWMSGEKTVEQALRAVSLDYLRSGNMLGLVYTPYCWSELKIVNS